MYADPSITDLCKKLSEDVPWLKGLNTRELGVFKEQTIRAVRAKLKGRRETALGEMCTRRFPKKCKVTSVRTAIRQEYKARRLFEWSSK
jgi:hypothetical protein